jgi:hypothetical protein
MWSINWRADQDRQLSLYQYATLNAVFADVQVWTSKRRVDESPLLESLPVRLF